VWPDPVHLRKAWDPAKSLFENKIPVPVRFRGVLDGGFQVRRSHFGIRNDCTGGIADSAVDDPGRALRENIAG
jgi:hypothetical protein